MTGIPRALLGAAALVLSATSSAQEILWKSDLNFYGDNTEFTGPYRKGETLLGAYFKTFLEVNTGTKTQFYAGVFGDYRSGGDKFLDVKPILSFRYHTDTSLGILGALQTVDRHGYLEPLEVTTLDFTRPIEYGVQWIENRPRFHADVYLNWQHLNTSESREIFDYGGVLREEATSFASLEAQVHGLHHGGQLFHVGPVTNNVVWGVGLRLHRDLPLAGASNLAVFSLQSKGKPDPSIDTPTIRGHGTYVRASIAPAGIVEAFFVWWRGTDFVTNEGDHNYGSPGLDGYYRARRYYQELGLVRRHEIERGIDLDAEVHLQRVDGKIQYSYRLLVRVPFRLVLRRGAASGA